MRATLGRIIRKTLNPFLGALHLELASTKRKRTLEEFLPFQETLTAAQKAGVSVGDYIDGLYNPGATRQTIDTITKAGVFEGKIDRICEIGPGSGRYLERVMEACQPSHYEIYETADDWAEYLVAKYHVQRLPCDRVRLGSTPTGSIDFAHAEKLFPGLPFLVTCNYIIEMARVVRPAGWVVFDVITETCMDEKSVAACLAANPWNWNWSPEIMPRQYMVDFAARRNLSLKESFCVDLWPVRTEVFVFRKHE